MAEMRAWQCRDWASIQDLALVTVPMPEPGPGQVRVRVAATGCNFADTLIVQGKYQEKPPLPFTPGMEVSGTIDAVGVGVGDLAVGQAVIAMPSIGGFAEQVLAEAPACLPLPDGLDMAQAAGFPITYGTAHIGLWHRANLRAGERLLVLGASGGVGIASVEIGKAMGAHVIAAASTDQKLDLAQQHGADERINYTDQDLRAALKASGPVDVVMDPVGGAVFEPAVRSLNWEGRLLTIGYAAGQIPSVAANILLVKNAAVMGCYWGAYLRKAPEVVAESFQTLLGWWQAGRLTPRIGGRYRFEDARQALQDLADRKAVGKLVVARDG